MKYATLIYQAEGGYEEVDEATAQAITAEYWAMREEPICIDGAHLQPAAMTTTVRRQGGTDLITDGPFADAKEVLAGLFVLDAPDLDAALEFARRIPAVRLGGRVEVRPLVEVPVETGR